MYLVVDELYDGVVFEQNFRIQRTMNVAHFRPWIYKQGTLVDGVFTLEILQNGELLKTSTIDYTEINSAVPSTYGHGYIRFDFDSLQLNHDRKQAYTEYTVKLYMSGHTTDTNNFIGTIRRYELKFYDTYGTDVLLGEAPNDMVEPLGFELYEYKY